MRSLAVLFFALLTCGCSESMDRTEPPTTASSSAVEVSGEYLEFIGQGSSGEGIMRRLSHEDGWFDLDGPTELFDGIEHGAPLVVEGQLEGNTLIASRIEAASSPSALIWPVSRDIRDNVGEQRVLVVLGNFEDTSFTSPTVSELETTFFGDGVGPSIDAYYREASAGKTWLTGRIYEHWVDLPGTQHCDDWQWSQDAMAAIDDDVDFTEYDVLVFLAPAGSCSYQAYSWAGRGTFSTPDGDVHVGLIFGDLDRAGSDYYTDRMAWVLTHEFGHTLGLQHQGSGACQPRAMAASCNFIVFSETTGKLGPMGWPDAGWPPLFNLYHQVRIGWLDDGEVQTVTQSGLYEIAPLVCRANVPGCASNTLPIGLQIPRRASGNSSDIYIEYRQPFGFDAVLPDVNGRHTNALSGATVHTNHGLFSIQVDASVSETVAPDSAEAALPPPADPLNPQPDEIFEDTESGIHFTTVEATSEHLVVDIQLGPDVGRGPELRLLSPEAGDHVTGAVTVTGRALDQSGVAGVTLEVSQYFTPVYSTPLASIGDDRYEGTWTVDPTQSCGLFRVQLFATDNAGYTSTDYGVVEVDCADSDNDGVYDIMDNCPDSANPTQGDYDLDGVGDPCDPCPADASNDEDGDGSCSVILGDLAGGACIDLVDFSAFAGSLYSGGTDLSGDLNSDGVIDLSDISIFAGQMGKCGDNCPSVSNPDQADTDGDLRGDACDFPRITETYPLDGEPYAGTSAPIIIYFDVPMESVDWSIEPELSRMAEFSPDMTELWIWYGPMQSFTEYTVTIHANGTSSADGDPMQQDYVFSFTTGM